jgi:hypothetical protein
LIRCQFHLDAIEQRFADNRGMCVADDQDCAGFPSAMDGFSA